MYVRSAFWLGQPKAGMEAQFRAAMDQTLIPRMRLFPGVKQLLGAPYAAAATHGMGVAAKAYFRDGVPPDPGQLRRIVEDEARRRSQ